MSEYSLHMKRGGKPYSKGHRLMYDAAIALLADRPAKILEVGTGIGVALRALMKANAVSRYVGFEPASDTAKFCNDHFHHWAHMEIPGYTPQKVRVIPVAFENTPDEAVVASLGGNADYALCIEVIEHVPAPFRLPVLEKIRRLTDRGLFLSTPSRETCKHGKMTPVEVADLMTKAGFRTSWVEWQWTTFFIGC